MNQELLNDIVRGKAVHEYHHAKNMREVDALNKYEPGSEEWLVYQEKIEELMDLYAKLGGAKQ